jgi:glycerol-3-phosphate acyltransferase PlsY
VTVPLWARIILLAVVAYLFGGIPWALVVGKLFFGVDVRTQGSGNLGATNVFRVLGTRAGSATLALDAAKGAAAVLMAMLIVPPSEFGTTAAAWAQIVAGLCAVLGHAYSPYLRFSGGKGVATGAGAVFVMTPLVATVMLGVFFAVTWWTSMVSAGSIAAAALFPLAVVASNRYPVPIIVFSFVGAALVLWRHRSNMRRILAGEERRIGWGRRQPDQAAERQPDESGEN